MQDTMRRVDHYCVNRTIWRDYPLTTTPLARTCRSQKKIYNIYVYVFMHARVYKKRAVIDRSIKFAILPPSSSHSQRLCAEFPNVHHRTADSHHL